VKWPLKLISVVTIGALTVVGLEATAGQWTIATDVQKYYSCLPYQLYLVSTLRGKDEIATGNLVQFRAPDYVERLTNAYEVIKIVAAVEGDSWKVLDNELFINGVHWGPLYLTTAIGKRIGDFDGEGIVPSGHIYVLGTNPSSYDSRYWGSLPLNFVKGKAHVIF